MIPWENLVAFVLASAVIIVIPGPSVLFVLGRYTAGQTSSPTDVVPFVHAHTGDEPWAVCAFGKTEHACVTAAAALGGQSGTRENSPINHSYGRQLALAWVLAQGEDIVAIPGTKQRRKLDDNLGALHLTLSAAELAPALRSPRLALLDIRPQDRFLAGHIPSALRVDRTDYSELGPIPGMTRPRAELEALLATERARADLEHARRMAAEALAAERAERVADLRHALRMIESAPPEHPTEQPASTAPDPVTPDHSPIRRRSGLLGWVLGD